MSELTDIKKEIIEAGGNPNHQRYQKGEARAVQEANRKVLRFQNDVQKRQPTIARHLADAINTVLSAVSVIFTSSVVILGILGAMLLAVVAETAAIEEGIRYVSPNNSWLYATGLMLLLIVLFTVLQIINNNHQEEEKVAVFSLRHTANYLTYFIGIGSEWHPRYRKETPMSLRVRLAIRILSGTVIAFGFMGRALPLVKDLQGNWVENLIHMITQSSLPDLLALVGMVLMTVALLRGFEFISYWVYREYVKLTGGVTTVNFFEMFSPEDEIEKAKLEFWRTELQRLKQKNF